MTMRRALETGRRGLLATLLLLTAAMPALAQDYDHEQTVDEAFKMRPGQTLFIRADMGSIEVRGTDGDEAVIRVRKGVDDLGRRDAEELFDRYTVSFRETSRGVEVEGDYDGPRNWRRGRQALRVHYEVRMPEGAGVELKTSGGSISVARIKGDTHLRTSGGALRLQDVGGEVDGQTSGGSITAEGLGGHARLRTSGGGITVRDVAGHAEVHSSGGSIRIEGVDGEVEAHTSGGSIRLLDVAGAVDASTSGGSITAQITRQPQRAMELSTSGGSVTLEVAPGIRADIDARASGGRVRADVPVTVRGEIGRTQLRGELNGGGPLLRLRSSGGGVHIREG